MSQKVVACDRCRELLDAHEGYDECEMHICAPCYEKNEISSGEHIYALKLWHWHESVRRDPDPKNDFPGDPLPQFWPNKKDGSPMPVHMIVKEVLGDDIYRLPCGTGCSCNHLPRGLQDSDLVIGKECIFLKMENSDKSSANSDPLRTLLLLYWWYSYYISRDTHPDFWPTFERGQVTSPKQLVKRTLFGPAAERAAA